MEKARQVYYASRCGYKTNKAPSRLVCICCCTELIRRGAGARGPVAIGAAPPLAVSQPTRLTAEDCTEKPA